MAKKKRAKKRSGAGGGSATAGNTAESQNPADSSEGGLGDFGPAGEAIQQTVAEDPLAKFVQQRWRELVTVLVVVFAFFYGKDVFQETRLESLRRSADILLDLQSQVEQLELLAAQLDEQAPSEDSAATNNDSEDSGDKATEGKSPEQLTEKQQEYKQGVEKAVELSKALAQERAPYKELADMYGRIIASLRQKSPATANGSAVASINDGLLGEGVLGELDTFHSALALATSDEQLPKAVEKLKLVVQNGQFAGSAALAVLYELSQLDGDSGDLIEQGQLKILVAGYLERNPDQRALLERELPQLF